MRRARPSALAWKERGLLFDPPEIQSDWFGRIERVREHELIEVLCRRDIDRNADDVIRPDQFARANVITDANHSINCLLIAAEIKIEFVSCPWQCREPDSSQFLSIGLVNQVTFDDKH